MSQNFIQYNGIMMPVSEVIKLKQAKETEKTAPKKAVTKKTKNEK